VPALAPSRLLLLAAARARVRRRSSAPARHSSRMRRMRFCLSEASTTAARRARVCSWRAQARAARRMRATARSTMARWARVKRRAGAGATAVLLPLLPLRWLLLRLAAAGGRSARREAALGGSLTPSWPRMPCKADRSALLLRVGEVG